MKAHKIRMSLKKYKKTQKYSLFLIATLLGFCIYQTLEYASLFEPTDSIRIPSLGTPQNVSELKTEQNLLLNDPGIKKNWGLLGTGGLSDINANRAWNITQGSRDIVVAIIDTGIDIKHPDIKNNLWVNEKEKNGKSGVDDDKNGCIDDIHGCNFITMTGDLTDNHGHGTHIAGIVGAEGGNGIGIAGVAPKVSLMILKYYDPKSSGNDNLKNTIKAIHYAIDQKASIINYSGGGLDYSKLEFEAIQRAANENILFVAAAGNEQSNSDQSHYYPANYPLNNIVSVTAINPEGNVLKSSNFGTKTVHIAAPGENIYSTTPGGKYGLLTGTSQATAFATGVAALIKSNNKDWNAERVKQQMLATADARHTVFGKTQTSGILNAWAALAIHSSKPVSGAEVAQTSPILSNTTVVDVSGRVPALSTQLNQINQIMNIINNENKIKNKNNL